MRLTAAGELFVRYIREQTGDVERMKSQIEDLKGLRRGTVRIACSQALALDFLPREIAAYRAKFPLVQFDVKVFDHERAMATLAAYEVDLVLVFRPPFLPNFQPLMSLRQRLVALMPADHPLATPQENPAERLRRLSGGARRAQFRRTAVARRGAGALELAFRHRCGIQLVRIPARHGAARQGDLVPDRDRRGRERTAWSCAQIDDRDVPRADLVLGQLRGRNLPVPAAKFAEQLARVLEAMRP